MDANTHAYRNAVFLVDTYRSKQKMIGLDSIFVKFSDVVFHENPLIGSRVRLPSYGQNDFNRRCTEKSNA